MSTNSNANITNRSRIRFMTQFAILLALEAIVCFTRLGSIPAFGIVATIAQVPVVVAAILLGTRAGAMMGFFMGLFSLMVWTFMPPPESVMIAFVFTPFYSIGELSGNFWSLVICFVPRIMVGVAAGLVFQALQRANKNKRRIADYISYGLAAIAGSMANTLLVMAGIYIFFGRDYASALGFGFELLLGLIGVTIATNGLLEAAITTLAAIFVCRPLKRFVIHN